ncbi:molybdate-binding protein [Paraoerskovia sediminicola]|uniref:Molybdate-binding protein n=1 Tax=Paraoerskovia sediminicola TaxID=1138587 RepID=A0ABN6XBP2_9CELL|nr:molybdate ABC transporter substrate-binding protein [Paraoerskovia sediminicola]BDZ42388.1 molybdate-binding protein [Paraoerskovia sediminicola]
MTGRGAPAPGSPTAGSPRIRGPWTGRRWTGPVAATALALLLTGCSTPSTTTSEGASGVTEPEGGVPTTTATLDVSAAASLRSVFSTIADEFEATHEGVDVRLSFAGSSTIVDQVLAGAPTDVVATADEATMQRLVDAGDANDPQLFANNSLTVVVPPGNPGDVTSLADLESTDLSTVVCAPEVPCGAATDAVADSAGLTIHRVSEEPSVTDVLAKVASGEADAGIVYGTDAALAGDSVEVVDTPEAASIVNHYPIAAVTGTDDLALAGEFVAVVTGTDGREALRAAGFGTP